jgi:hypothetical protein
MKEVGPKRSCPTPCFPSTTLLFACDMDSNWGFARLFVAGWCLCWDKQTELHASKGCAWTCRQLTWWQQSGALQRRINKGPFVSLITELTFVPFPLQFKPELFHISVQGPCSHLCMVPSSQICSPASPPVLIGSGTTENQESLWMEKLIHM